MGVPRQKKRGRATAHRNCGGERVQRGEEASCKKDNPEKEEVPSVEKDLQTLSSWGSEGQLGGKRERKPHASSTGHNGGGWDFLEGLDPPGYMKKKSITFGELETDDVRKRIGGIWVLDAGREQGGLKRITEAHPIKKNMKNGQN